MMIVSYFVFNKIINKFPVKLITLVPVIVDTQIQAVGCLWNHDGSVLAVCGIKTELEDSKESNVVMFFTAFGVVINIIFFIT